MLAPLSLRSYYAESLPLFSGLVYAYCWLFSSTRRFRSRGHLHSRSSDHFPFLRFCLLWIFIHLFALFSTFGAGREIRFYCVKNFSFLGCSIAAFPSHQYRRIPHIDSLRTLCYSRLYPKYFNSNCADCSCIRCL